MKNYGIGLPARGPKQHQLCGQQIAFNLIKQLDADDFVIIHEANVVDDDVTSKAPDVTVYDMDGTPIVCFQVCLATTLHKELSLLNDLFSYGIKEVFIFIYKPIDIFDYRIIAINKYVPGSTGYKESKNTNVSTALDIDDIDELPDR